MKSDLQEYMEPLKSEAAETVNDIQARMGKSAKDLTNAAHGYIKDNPWKSVAIVAVAACLVGYFLSGSDRD